MGGSVEEVTKALSPTATGTEPRLAPRVQPLQLLNQGFEQLDDSQLTIDEYHALTSATWPETTGISAEEAERHFWQLMATRPAASKKFGTTALDAAKVG